MKFIYNNHIIDLSDEDSVAAIRNDCDELLRRYNPEHVAIQRLKAAPGEVLHLLVTAHHITSHYLTSPEDVEPKSCSAMSVHIVVHMGYPGKSIEAWYEPACYLASPNVFTSGWACIDIWKPFKSSMISVCDKLLLDMVHDPEVTNYQSRANPHEEITEWHKGGAAKYDFPTINPRKLFSREGMVRASDQTKKNAPPPLPGRRA